MRIAKGVGGSRGMWSRSGVELGYSEVRMRLHLRKTGGGGGGVVKALGSSHEWQMEDRPAAAGPGRRLGLEWGAELGLGRVRLRSKGSLKATRGLDSRKGWCPLALMRPGLAAPLLPASPDP